jgi:hypothetical protein
MPEAVKSESITSPSVDAEIDKIAERIMKEIEGASSKDLSDDRYAKTIFGLSDVHYTSKILKEIDEVSSGPDGEIEKRAVIKVLLFSTWLQRLYFIIRSFIMGQVGLVITFGVILYYGSINVTLAVSLGLFTFIASLVITRLFDPQITAATKKIVGALAGHRNVRDFIMNHF